MPRSLTPVPVTTTPGDLTVEEATVFLGVLGETALRIAVTVVGGVVIALILRYLIHRTTARVVRAATPLARIGRTVTATASMSLGAGVHDRRGQRADTINSVLGSAVNVVVGAVVLVTVMQQLGWDIGPILASAGIVGVAIGFGSQSLVKDVISGLFMLMEDQYGVGDIVDTGTVAGTVEAVGLRVTRIRDVGGTLWYCRNGEILRVGNQSQGWARAVVDVRVGPDAPLDRTRDLLRAVAQEVVADEAFAGSVLGEPTVTFVEDLAAGGTQVRVAVNTATGAQASVASELRSRIRTALDDAGIALAG